MILTEDSITEEAPITFEEDAAILDEKDCPGATEDLADET